jgi:hypothetical protein
MMQLKTQQLKNNLEKLNTLIREGNALEAFEKYYSEDVIIQVNGNPPITGKEQNRKNEMIFLKEIGKLSSAEMKSVTFGGIDDNITMTEWALNVDNQDSENKTIHRVNVQHWKDDVIINEKVYFCGDQRF